jgi:hypothetical protein
MCYSVNVDNRAGAPLLFLILFLLTRPHSDIRSAVLLYPKIKGGVSPQCRRYYRGYFFLRGEEGPIFLRLK